MTNLKKGKEDNVIEFINKMNIFCQKRDECYVNYIIYLINFLRY